MDVVSTVLYSTIDQPTETHCRPTVLVHVWWVMVGDM